MKSLEEACLRAAVGTTEQFEACLAAAEAVVSPGKTPDRNGTAASIPDTAAAEGVKNPEPAALGLVYIESAFFDASQYADLVQKAHAAGLLCGLRLPYIWRERAERYFDAHLRELAGAGFDVFLFMNIESLLYFAEHGLLQHTPYLTDHSIYSFNTEAVALLQEMLPPVGHHAGITFPLELNEKELAVLRRSLGKGTCHHAQAVNTELVVYGRAPMMVTAQCMNKTVCGCDRTEKVLYLKDRKGAEMPVRNSCRFCYNMIYNAVPTVLFDLPDTLRRIAPDTLRYEFTTETGDEVRRILSGRRPEAFTRGHLKRGV